MRVASLRGFLYELERTLLSAPILLTVGLLVAISFGVLATLAQSSQTSYAVSNEAEYYFTSGEAHVLLYAFDNYGRPVSGVAYNLTFYSTGGPSPGSTVGTAEGASSADGMTNLSVPLADGTYSVVVAYSDPTSSGSVSTTMTHSPLGAVEPLCWGFASAVASGTGFSSTTVLQVFYAGPGGSTPSDYQVYWAGPVSASSTPAPLPESEMTYLGTLSSYHATYPLTVPGATSGSSTVASEVLQVEIFSGTGALVAQDLNQSASAFTPSQTSQRASDAAFSFVGTILAFFVPLMAILAAYSTYGKDRVSGVIESALCRPVSWVGLALSRYAAVIVALTVAVALSVGVIDALVFWAVGTALTSSVVLALVGSLLLEVGAFVGLIFVISYLVRSSSLLIGAAVGVWALFGVAWNTLAVDVAIALGNPVGSPSYSAAVASLDLVNPGDFVSLTQSLVTGAAASTVSGATVTAATLSAGSLVAVGLLWVVAPVMLFVYLVETRD